MNIKLKTNLTAAPSYQLAARYIDGIKPPKMLSYGNPMYETLECKIEHFQELQEESLVNKFKNKFRRK